MNRLWTFCEQLRRRSAACGSGTILQLSCYSSAQNPHPPALDHHHKQLLVIMHWLCRLSSCPSSADWRRKSNVVFKTFISCGSEKNVCHRHTIKTQHVFVLIKDGLLEERGVEGGVFKLYRADVELSCPRTAHPSPLQTDNGRNVLPPVQSCTSNILKLCPSALPHHHQKIVGFNSTASVLD